MSTAQIITKSDDQHTDNRADNEYITTIGRKTKKMSNKTTIEKQTKQKTNNKNNNRHIIYITE